MNYESVLVLSLVGALGALFRDVVADGKIIFPKRTTNGMALGFVGSMFIGGIVGWLANNSPLTAFCAGFAGFSTLAALIPQKKVSCETAADETATGPAATAARPKPIIHKPFLGNWKITQRFGENPSWYKALGYAGHFGIDFGLPFGTSIKACDSGVVIRSDFNKGNGNFVEIQHSWGTSLYCHMSDKPLFALGQLVMGKVTIGYAGNTGAVRSSLPANVPHRGTHLHFSIKINGIENKPFKNFIDPMPYFKEAVI